VPKLPEAERSLEIPAILERTIMSMRPIMSGLVSLAMVLAVGCGSPEDRARPRDETGIHLWDLTTGSHIAYAHVPAADSSSSVPLVFLHGGPGACQLADVDSVRPWCERLAKRGFDVFLYDQVGSGLSERLSDPRDYTVLRHVEDLEAVRRTIGDKPFILVGESWGATLAANYMAAYPDNVIKAVMVSPGPIDPGEWTAKRTSAPMIDPELLTWVQRWRGPASLQRFVQLDLLLKTDVSAAYEFMGDSELDSVMDQYLTATVLPHLVHDPKRFAGSYATSKGVGGWSMVMTSWDATSKKEAVRAPLASLKTPVLILRGEFDFLPAGIADQYTSTFSRSTLLRVPAAGHLIRLDQPEEYHRAIEAFLVDVKGVQHPR
jgi:proline iminopeptidase